jgi:hypothetical protein
MMGFAPDTRKKAYAQSTELTMAKHAFPQLLGILLLALGSHAQTRTIEWRLTIHTPEGPVSVLDPESHFATRIGNTIFLEENNRFSIGFLESDNSFSILLSATLINVVRKDAEDRFLRDLGISEKDACKLKVSVRVPASVAVKTDDRDIGLSFCPSDTPHQ